MKKIFLLLIFAVTAVSSFAQSDQVIKNFIRYYEIYREFSVGSSNFYGQQKPIEMQYMGGRFYPLPDFPNELLRAKQDSLCGTLKVKNKTFYISKTSRYSTSFDEQGRITINSTPSYRAFQYYPDSVKEKIGVNIECTYDSKGRLILMMTTNPINPLILCKRVYSGDLLMSSFEMVKDLSYKYTKSVTYTFTYNSENSKLESIHDGENEWKYNYNEEEPEQISSVNDRPLIYNMQGKMIERGGLKINYNENGTMKSYNYTFYSIKDALSYTYDEANRLIAIKSNNYMSGQNVTFSYRKDGLLDKINDVKVKYEFY